jgi:hypothetical protein
MYVVLASSKTEFICDPLGPNSDFDSDDSFLCDVLDRIAALLLEG